MKKLILLPILLFTFTAKAEMLWKPDSISYELKQAHELLGIGLMIELNQSLSPGEYGWKQSRIDVPESWANAQLKMRKGTIYITIGTEEYYLNSSNKGELSFAILDGGNKSDAHLLEIWAKYGKGI
ncbi:hypothetical protein [Pseudoalteromonas sp. R3]|uniref:hypothetical protein n=1 Tax=Pseudoalteromonas sp. R3 TaxID=1709477 RepID=UPI0006B5B33E|nr:hypothetical protein [Pseudoalteromonas sp. R3]AZZ98496.1 hypothetical protein ELR70_16085 [Pseudoalteromonas sp. R3]